MSVISEKTEIRTKPSKKSKTEVEHIEVVKPETKKNMPSVHEDLCSTCSVSPKCIYRNDYQAVYECEEYDNHIHSASQVAKPSQDAPTGDVPKGLCINCIHRGNCMNTDVEAGIWHCEMYE